jgi:hypothetical protein
MISDANVYRAASKLIERYRADALREAMRRIDRMLDRRDTSG